MVPRPEVWAVFRCVASQLHRCSSSQLAPAPLLEWHAILGLRPRESGHATIRHVSFGLTSLPCLDSRHAGSNLELRGADRLPAGCFAPHRARRAPRLSPDSLAGWLRPSDPVSRRRGSPISLDAQRWTTGGALSGGRRF